MPRGLFAIRRRRLGMFGDLVDLRGRAGIADNVIDFLKGGEAARRLARGRRGWARAPGARRRDPHAPVPAPEKPRRSA